MDKTKINALIRYSYSEIELHINALKHVNKLFGNALYLGKEKTEPYEKLLEDLKRIKKDLLDKYNNARDENNRFFEDIDEQYDRELK